MLSRLCSYLGAPLLALPAFLEENSFLSDRNFNNLSSRKSRLPLGYMLKGELNNAAYEAVNLT